MKENKRMQIKMSSLGLC